MIALDQLCQKTERPEAKDEPIYDIREQTAEELRARSFVRLSEIKEEQARFIGPRERVLIDFGERGLLPLSEGTIHRTTYTRPHRKISPVSIYLELFGFDEDRKGTDGAVVAGIWGPEHMSNKARGIVVYRGTLDVLPPGLLDDTIALLDHRGGIELEPWDED